MAIGAREGGDAGHRARPAPEGSPAVHSAREVSFPELVAHLSRSTPLSPTECQRVVEEVLAYFSERTEDFVRRRHRELRAQRHSNEEIFACLAEELERHRVLPPPLSRRQLRRLVYG